jgi:hypothetical protein
MSKAIDFEKGIPNNVIDFKTIKQKYLMEEKKMKMKMHEVVERYSVIERLSMLDGKIPIVISYRIGKLQKKMQKFNQDFLETRQKLYLQYGKVVDEKTKVMNIPPENQDIYTEEMNVFGNEDIEIDVMPISLVEFYACEKKFQGQPYQISGREMFLVEFLWNDIDKIEEIISKEAETKKEK